MSNLTEEFANAAAADRFSTRVRFHELKGASKAEAIKKAVAEDPADHRAWVSSLRGKPMQQLGL